MVESAPPNNHQSPLNCHSSKFLSLEIFPYVKIIRESKFTGNLGHRESQLECSLLVVSRRVRADFPKAQMSATWMATTLLHDVPSTSTHCCLHFTVAVMELLKKS